MLGFDAFGVAKAEPLDEERERLAAWLAGGRHGTMSYLSRWSVRRLDPDTVLPGARSVLCFAHNYHAPDPSPPADAPRVSRYAWGRDYHRVLKRKLAQIAERMRAARPDAKTRVCVDTAPVMEKAWAERAGLGWRGKHTNLVSRSRGSWTFLGEILTTLELPADAPHLDFCGTCTRCVDACPTQAFPRPYELDARRCISYLTIERRGELTDAEGAAIGEHLFGCDICLEVCPWNRFAEPTMEADLAPRAEIVNRTAEAWAALSEEDVSVIHGTALTRAGAEGLRRNARHVLRNRGG